MAITSKDFAVDSGVQSKLDKTRKGTVIGHSKNDIFSVAIEWADGTLSKVNVHDLTPTLSAEEEFKALQVVIGEKFAAAAALIEEANQLAEEAGHDPVGDNYDFYDQVRPLVNAMDSAGWNSSSWSC